jgi:nitrogenase molybdenum-iron protein alpha/beta subunit
MMSEFEIPLMNQRALFGAFLAAHAIPDAVDILFTGVGCKPKAQRQIAQHDRARQAGSKMVWADIGEREAIGGPLSRLENTTLETVRRRDRIGAIFVTTSAAAELLSADLPAAIRRIGRRAGCPVVALSCAGFGGDMYAGYAAVQRALLGMVDWRRRSARRRTLGIVGHWFHRYEADQLADVDELQRLLAGAGARPGPIWFSGAPVADLMRTFECAALLRLPYLPAAPPTMGARPVLSVPLPIGGAATEAFVRAAARAGGGDARRAQRFLRGERERAEPMRKEAHRELSGKRALLLADTPLASGLFSALAELGVEVPLVVLLDETLGGERALHAAIRPGAGGQRPIVLENPGYGALESVFSKVFGKRGRGADFIVGPDLWLPPLVRRGVAWVEVGFPSNRWHPDAPEPILGFSGMRSLARRLLAGSAGP